MIQQMFQKRQSPVVMAMLVAGADDRKESEDGTTRPMRVSKNLEISTLKQKQGRIFMDRKMFFAMLLVGACSFACFAWAQEDVDDLTGDPIQAEELTQEGWFVVLEGEPLARQIERTVSADATGVTYEQELATKQLRQLLERNRRNAKITLTISPLVCLEKPGKCGRGNTAFVGKTIEGDELSDEEKEAIDVLIKSLRKNTQEGSITIETFFEDIEATIVKNEIIIAEQATALALIEQVGKIRFGENFALPAPRDTFQLSVNALVLDLPESLVNDVRALPGVLAVHPNYSVYPLMGISVPTIGADVLHAPPLNITGCYKEDGECVTPIRVGVMDTGIAYGSNDDLPQSVMWINPGECLDPDCTPNGIDDDKSGVADDIHGFQVNGCKGIPTNPTCCSTPCGLLSKSTHGTAVAGVVRFVAPDASLIDMQVLSCSGSGSTSTIIKAIEWAMGKSDCDTPSSSMCMQNCMTLGERRADVLNMSIGIMGQVAQSQDYPLNVTVNTTVDIAKMVIVAASGNGPRYFSVYSPGAAEKAITVGQFRDMASTQLEDDTQFISLDQHSRGYLYADSSSGSVLMKPEIVALRGICVPQPDSRCDCVAITGTNCVGILGNDRVGNNVSEPSRLFAGSSAAAPHVAGAAALLLERFPLWDDKPERIKAALLNYARNGVETDLPVVCGSPFTIMQGAGALRVDTAANAKFLVEPGVFSFGEVAECASSISKSQVITVHNRSGQGKTFSVSVNSAFFGSSAFPHAVSFTAEPSSFFIANGGTKTFTLSLDSTDAMIGSNPLHNAVCQGNTSGALPYGYEGMLFVNDDSTPPQAVEVPFLLAVPGPLFFGSGNLSPIFGCASGGQTVRIFGGGFTANTKVYFGGEGPAQVVEVNPTMIEVLTPPHPPGLVDVAMVGECGQSVTKTGAFTYYANPVVTSIDPTIIPRGVTAYSKAFGSGFSNLSVSGLRDDKGVYAIKHGTNCRTSSGTFQSNCRVNFTVVSDAVLEFQTQFLSPGTYDLIIVTACESQNTLADDFTIANFGYVPQFMSNVITRINVDTNEVIDSVPLEDHDGDPNTDIMPLDIALVRAGQRLLTLTDGNVGSSPKLRMLNATTLSEEAIFDFGTIYSGGGAQGGSIVTRVKRDPIDPNLAYVVASASASFDESSTVPIPLYFTVHDVSSKTALEDGPIAFVALHNGIDANDDGIVDGTSFPQKQVYPIDVDILRFNARDKGVFLTEGVPGGSFQQWAFVSTAGAVETECLQFEICQPVGGQIICAPQNVCTVVGQGPNCISVIDLNPQMCGPFENCSQLVPNPNYLTEIAVLGCTPDPTASGAEIPQELGLAVSCNPHAAFIYALNQKENFMYKLDAVFRDFAYGRKDFDVDPVSEGVQPFFADTPSDVKRFLRPADDETYIAVPERYTGQLIITDEDGVFVTSVDLHNPACPSEWGGYSCPFYGETVNPTNDQLDDIAIGPNGQLFVSRPCSGDIAVVDTATWSLAGTISDPANPIIEPRGIAYVDLSPYGEEFGEELFICEPSPDMDRCVSDGRIRVMVPDGNGSWVTDQIIARTEEEWMNDSSEGLLWDIAVEGNPYIPGGGLAVVDFGDSECFTNCFTGRLHFLEGHQGPPGVWNWNHLFSSTSAEQGQFFDPVDIVRVQGFTYAVAEASSKGAFQDWAEPSGDARIYDFGSTRKVIRGLLGASGVDVLGPHDDLGACGGSPCTGMRFVVSDSVNEGGRIFKLEKPVVIPTGERPQAAATVTISGSGGIQTRQIWVASGRDDDAHTDGSTNIVNVIDVRGDVEVIQTVPPFTTEVPINLATALTPAQCSGLGLSFPCGPFNPTSMAVVHRIPQFSNIPTSVYITMFDSDVVLVYRAVIDPVTEDPAFTLVTTIPIPNGPRRILIPPVQ